MNLMKMIIILVSIVVSSVLAQDIPISVTSINSDQIEKLPTNSRNFFDIIKATAGINLSSNSNHADYDRRGGITLRASTDAHGSNLPFIKNVPVLNTFRWDIGVQYEQLGSKLTTKNSWEGGKSNNKIKFRFNYLSFPITFAYDLLFLPCELYFMSGLTPRFLIAGRENWKYKSTYNLGGIDYTDTQKGEEDIKKYTNTFDMGLVFGFGQPFNWKDHNFNVEATYEMGLFNIWNNSDSDSDDSGDSKLKNNSFKLTASYVIPLKK